MPLNVGSRLAHYDVTALIGEGGMGQVYQATDTKLNRRWRVNPCRELTSISFPMMSGCGSFAVGTLAQGDP